MAAMHRDWDIFCRVIDNFGDIGVCWRLARQLANEHGLRVRLWVDELDCLVPLCPEIDCTRLTQQHQGVDVCRWMSSFADVAAAAVVIEAFACALPAVYVEAMAARATPPCWINLEYLTAEHWAEEWHGLVSPHPTLPLRKSFFFPGFSEQSGGLLREKMLFQQRDAYLGQVPARDTLEISLFCYDHAPVGELLDALADGSQRVRCHVPPGKPLAAVAAHLGSSEVQQIGNLELLPIPFLSQTAYDELLWRCDINFVRGEDSFVRAQWAGKPLVWQIYPQEDAAHWPKLTAFVDCYGKHLAADSRAALERLFYAWNRGDGVRAAWPDFLAQRTALAAAAGDWADALGKQPDLASRLVKLSANTV